MSIHSGSTGVSAQLLELAAEFEATAEELHEAHDWDASWSAKEASKELYRLAEIAARSERRNVPRNGDRRPVTAWG